jgi:hypothetical protein
MSKIAGKQNCEVLWIENGQLFTHEINNHTIIVYQEKYISIHGHMIDPGSETD